MPRRPARPVSWVYSPGVSSWWPLPPNLVTSSMTTERAGMLIPRARVSVAKTTFTSASAKHASTASRNGGTMPAWWAATPASRPADVARVAEHGQVLVGEGIDVGLDDRADPLALLGGRQPQPVVQAVAHRLVAARPGEHEVDRRQQPLGRQSLDHLHAAGPVQLRPPRGRLRPGHVDP